MVGWWSFSVIRDSGPYIARLMKVCVVITIAAKEIWTLLYKNTMAAMVILLRETYYVPVLHNTVIMASI
jgi:hypothetical protein